VQQKYLVTYGDGIYTKQKERLKREAEETKWFSRVFSYGREDVEEFYQQHKNFIDSNPKGFGLWIWKPWLIRKALAQLKESDILIYCDAGVSFINVGQFKESREKAFQDYVSLLNSSSRPVLAFAPDASPAPYLNKQFSKMFLLKKAELHNDDIFLNSAQPEATVVLMRKTSFTTAFIEKWAYLVLWESYKLVDDNLYDEKELLGFLVHRHDQSILSVLSYKNKTHVLNGQHLYGLSPFWAGRMTDEGKKKFYADPPL
jgi:hypothetical protein